MALGRAGARGSAITLGAQGVRFLAQLVSIAVLARLLPPADFGLIALVLAVISVGELFRDFGLSTAAIQSEKLTRVEKSSLFWLNIVVGSFLAVLVVAITPLVAVAFQEPRLTEILPITAVAFLINGIQAQFRVDLVRSLRFTAIAITDLSGHLSGIAVAIPLAMSGLGVWSLVAQQLTAASIICLSRAFVVQWKPRARFSLLPAKRFLKTGTHLLASLLLGYAATNADTVTIGLRLDAGQLGFYSRAYQLIAAPVGQLLSPLTNVALPLLTRVRSDPDRYSRYVMAMFLPLAYASAILFGFVIASSGALVEILLGDGWQASAPILAILAAGGVFQFMNHVGYWVFVSSGNAASMVRYSLLTQTLSVGLVVSGSIFGVLGVAVGYSLGLALTWPIQVLWLHKLVKIPRSSFLLAGSRALVISAFCAVSGRFATEFVENSLLQCVFVFGAICVVLLAACAVPSYRRDLQALRYSISLVRRADG